MADTILVTGATGFLGGALVRSLRAAGPVRGIGRDAAALRRLAEAGIDVARIDLAAADAAPLAAADASPLAAALRNVATVVHCAALSSAWGRRAAFVRDNIAATRALVAAMQTAGVPRLILISSASVYFRFRDQADTREDMVLPSPVNAYAWSKAEAERLALAAPGLTTTVIRPRGLYGFGDTALLPRLLAAARRGPLPLFRNGRAAIDLTHVDDAVAAIAAVLARPEQSAGRVYNVSGGEPLPVRAIVTEAAARAGQNVAWRPMPWPLALAGARANEALHRIVAPGREPRVTAYAAGLFAFSQSLNLDRIAADMDWRPAVRFEDGLRRTFAQRSPHADF